MSKSPSVYLERFYVPISEYMSDYYKENSPPWICFPTGVNGDICFLLVSRIALTGVLDCKEWKIVSDVSIREMSTFQGREFYYHKYLIQGSWGGWDGI